MGVICRSEFPSFRVAMFIFQETPRVPDRKMNGNTNWLELGTARFNFAGLQLTFSSALRVGAFRFRPKGFFTPVSGLLRIGTGGDLQPDCRQVKKLFREPGVERPLQDFAWPLSLRRTRRTRQNGHGICACE